MMLVLLGIGSVMMADGFIIVPHGGKIFPPPRPRPRPILPPPPHFDPFPLEVVYHRVKVGIQDQVAVTYIDQEFYNPTHRRLEGYYIFPIPRGAVMKKFSMFIDGKETQAELLDAKKARKIYEDIVRRHRDPALLEYMGEGLFKARIFPIEPRGKKRVKISYREVLEMDNRTVQYLYPLNTEKFSAKPLKDVGIQVTVDTSEDIKNIYCPTHEVEVVRKGSRKAVIGYEAKEIKPDRDFKLYFSIDKNALGVSLLSYKKAGEDGFFFLSLSPGFSKGNQEIAAKDITFVLDTSGSMAGEKMRQARKALLFCIENLNNQDRFEIIRFSTEAEALFQKFAPVGEGNLGKAREYIKGLKPIGGTNIDEALGMALKMEKRKGRPYMVVFLTDGKPTIGETDEAKLLARIKENNASGLRVFTFGIGHDINTHLLDKITEYTRAYRTYIAPEEDIEVKVSSFYSKVQSPVMTDLKLDYGSGIRISKTYPMHLPDLFKGSSIMLFGRYKGNGDSKIELTGLINNREKSFRFDVAEGFKSHSDSDSEKHDFIPALWASRRVGYLLDQIRLHGKSKELVDEVVSLAREYGIVTPYTSYLIVEDERRRVVRREIRRHHMTAPQMALEDRAVHKKLKREYDNLQLKSGASSVQASEETQGLNMAYNIEGVNQSKKRDAFQQQVKNIQGRAMYNVGKSWVDSTLQRLKNQTAKRIRFASEAYFQLIKDEPLSAQFLALGKNVRFTLNNQIYEIYE